MVHQEKLDQREQITQKEKGNDKELGGIFIA